MNQYQHVIVHYKGHSLFRFPQFLSNAPFPFQDPIQNTKLHLIFMSSRFFSVITGSQTFFVFDKMFICGTGQLECPSIGIRLIFFLWLAWVYAFFRGRLQSKEPFLLHHTKGITINII